MNLYQLTQEMIELDVLLESAEDPDDPAVFDAIQRALALQDERERKVDAYCCLIAEISARAVARKAEAKRLSENASRQENKVKALKRRLLESFEALGIGKLETERFTVSAVKNGGKVPLQIEPFAEIPEEFQRITISPDNDKIRAALEAGDDLPFAQLGERGKHMRIK